MSQIVLLGWFQTITPPHHWLKLPVPSLEWQFAAWLTHIYSCKPYGNEREWLYESLMQQRLCGACPWSHMCSPTHYNILACTFLSIKPEIPSWTIFCVTGTANVSCSKWQRCTGRRPERALRSAYAAGEDEAFCSLWYRTGLGHSSKAWSSGIMYDVKAHTCH